MPQTSVAPREAAICAVSDFERFGRDGLQISGMPAHKIEERKHPKWI